MTPRADQSVSAQYRDGRVELQRPVDWPDGTQLIVSALPALTDRNLFDGHVIIVGFGLAGRSVADFLDTADLPYSIIERNPSTVETQRALGRRIVHGDVTESEILISAGLYDATILALTIPEEAAVLKATSIARRLRPEIYIIARTNYSSQGMKASQLGADEVIKAEQAVALQFHEKISRCVHRSAS